MAQQNIDYNLTDNAKESFNFQLGDLVFNFRYPTTREMRDLAAKNNELQEMAQEKEADDKLPEDKKSGKDYDKLIKDSSAASEAKMNELVTPVDHENQISEVLEDMPINVVRNFRNMMAREINLS